MAHGGSAYPMCIVQAQQAARVRVDFDHAIRDRAYRLAKPSASNLDQDKLRNLRQGRLATGACGVADGERFEEVFAHIEENLFEPLTVREVAGVAGLSPFHFSRLFTVRAGSSVMSYVRMKRMSRAAQRLQLGEKINLVELAFDCGFESQEAFTRAFRRVVGMTPGRFKDVSNAYADGEKPMSAKPSAKQLDLVLQGPRGARRSLLRAWPPISGPTT